MNKSRNVVFFTLVIIASLWAIREWQITASATSRFGIGPDVIVGDIPDIRRWGASGDSTSFSIATTSCNIGDARLDWIANSNVHPAISQNMYRIKNGRMEQIGMSWLKHGFAVAAGSLCGTCTDPSSVYLGVGCSDPYGAFLNGSQSRLGPRSEINAATGFFPWPHADLPQTGTLDGRIRVKTSDLDPGQNAGARYFVESQYVHPQDAASGNNTNNGSYREAFVEPQGANGWDIEVGAPPTVREEAAINAWKAVHSDVQLYFVDVPNDGRIVVAVRVTQPKTGGFHTEVAIENLTSHQSVRSLGVAFRAGTATNPGFNDIDYQFENYSGNDWTPVVNGNAIEWSTETFAQNENANALRWNTLYSYWCDSDNSPTKLVLGLFRPGTTDEVTIDLSNAVLADGTKLLDGLNVAGTLSDLTDSDDRYFELDPSPTKNPRKQKIHLILQGVSLTDEPCDFCFVFESVMLGGPSGDVIQSIEMLNYDSGKLELLDLRAVATSDESIMVTPTGDLSRFVQDITNEMTVHVTWTSYSFSNAPFTWSIDVDEAIWNVAG